MCYLQIIIYLFIHSFIHSFTICDDSAPSECYQHKLQPLCFHLCQVPLLSMLRSLQSLKKAINLSERSSRYSWSSLLLGLLKRCLHFTSFSRCSDYKVFTKWTIIFRHLLLNFSVLLRKGTGSRFSACSFIKMLFFCRTCCIVYASNMIMS